MSKTTANKTDLQLKTYITEALAGLLRDSDFELDLTEKAKKRLSVFRATRRTKMISLEKVKTRYAA